MEWASKIFDTCLCENFTLSNTLLAHSSICSFEYIRKVTTTQIDTLIQKTHKQGIQVVTVLNVFFGAMQQIDLMLTCKELACPLQCLHKRFNCK